MSAIVNKHHGRVLYLTDKFGVRQGYLPAFNAITSRVGLPSRSLIITDIYKLVSKPLVKYRTDNTPRFNPAMMAQTRSKHTLVRKRCVSTSQSGGSPNTQKKN